MKPQSVWWAALPLAVALLGGCEGISGDGAGADAHAAPDTPVTSADTADAGVPGASDVVSTDPGGLPEDAGIPPVDGTSSPDIAPDTSSAAPLDWGECPEFFSTECAYVELPLDWSEPDGQTIRVMVARRPAADPNAPQLWLLQGGPGGSGGTFHTAITAPHQTWTLVPGSPHGVAIQSPVATAGADTCGLQVILSFLADPTGTPDTSCLAELAPVPFSFPAETNQFYLGTDDLWENPVTTSGSEPPPARPLPPVPPMAFLPD